MTHTHPVSGTTVNVRLYTYKSVRHYGGRNIATFQHTCRATFLHQQQGTFVVELLEPCAGFPVGHKIAVLSTDFNI